MLEFKQDTQVRAPQALVFDSFSKATGLREWFCDRAFTQPHLRGRYWMRWDDGTRVEGQYMQVVEPEQLTFSWRSTDIPGQTMVRVALQRVEKQVQVSLVHSGFGAGPDWGDALERIGQIWDAGLENLKSVLESGIDLRHAHRPYLGIRWGLSHQEDIQVLQVLGGHGAQAEELRRGDIILRLAGQEIHGYRSMVDALEACDAGECIQVRVRRGDEEFKAQVTLGAIARSEKLVAPRNIAAGVRDRQIKMQRLLSDTLLGTTEEEASRRPSPDAWSVKEILAHLSVTERDLHHRLYQIVMRSWDDTPSGNPAMLPEALAAAMARTDTLSRLLDRFAQDQAETLAFFAALRPEVLANKARYRRLAETVDMSEHTRQHIQQIAETLSALCQKRVAPVEKTVPAEEADLTQEAVKA